MTSAVSRGHAILSHGMERGPNATKVARLAALAERHGFVTERVDDVGVVDPDRRLERLLARVSAASRPLLLMGSSLGAYVSGRASLVAVVDALFLLAPPVALPGGYPRLDLRAPRIAIVHGWRDELIPPEPVIELATRHRASLHLVDADHRLGAALPFIEREFEARLHRLCEQHALDSAR
jgi:predicted esterase